VASPLTDAGGWAERPPFPPDEPPATDDAEAVLAYERAASESLDTLHDTRRTRAEGDYVTYHWALSFYGEYALHPLLEDCRVALADSGLELIPRDRVWLPLLRIGAAEDLTAAELSGVAWHTRQWAAEQAQFRVQLGPPQLGPGGVRLSVTPWTDLLRTRRAVRATTREVVGLRGPWLRELIPYRPHVPLAYATCPTPAAPLRARLAGMPAHRPVALRVRRLTLLRLTRGAGGTGWYTLADMALGSRAGF
jgi:hypothetical protein